MEDNIRAVQNFKPYTKDEMAATQQRAIVGQGVYTGPTMEYWKKKSSPPKKPPPTDILIGLLSTANRLEHR